MRIARLRIRPLLPWMGAALAVALVTFGVWFFVMRGGPSDLELLAWGRNGLVRDGVRLDTAGNDPLGPLTPRVPLLMALRNAGRIPLQPGTLSVSLPSWLRLEDDEGTALSGAADAGNPLIRYDLPLEPVRIPPAGDPRLLPGVPRLWIRPFTSPWRCTLDDEGLPAFLPAPPLDPGLLARGTLFWSVREARTGRRATGTLAITLDPGLFLTTPVAEPPDYPARVLPVDSPRPDLSRLTVTGTRVADCGGLIEPLTLRSTVYATAGNGRILEVSVEEGAERLLFDLDGNDTIEAEAWTSAGAGQLDRVRRARYPIPAFLLPLPPPPPPPPPDTVRTDPVAAPAAPVRADTTSAVRDTTAGR